MSQILHHRLKLTQQGVVYWGVKLYNQIPEEGKNHNSICDVLEEAVSKTLLLFIN